jgi:quercetin dioxygenase-like cupin family protein
MSNLAIAEQPQGEIIDVISHHFVGGVYAKEMRIKDGYMVKQHAHEYDHLSYLVSGCVIVETDDEQNTYYGPCAIPIPAHVSHSVTPVNGDAVWLCVHKTDCEDIASVDEVLIEKQA